MKHKQFWNISVLLSCLVVRAPVQADWQQQAKLTVPGGYGNFGESVGRTNA